MKQITTQKIFKDQLPWIKYCCKALNKTFAELIEEWERQVKMKKQQEFYSKLPPPIQYKRPLENVRIRKIRNYKVCIQKGMASYT